MKTGRNILIRSAVCVTLIALAASAHANVRPFGSAASLSNLQTVFNDIGSTIDAVSDQTTEALYEPTGAGNSIAAYVATATWDGGDIDFGIYDMDNPAEQLSLFGHPSNSSGASVMIQFNETLNSVRVIDLSTWLPVDSSTYYFKEFGFYVNAPQVSSTTYFSQDALNQDSLAHFLTYEGKGDQVTFGTSGTYSDINHWYIAAEASTDSDFDDIVVQMESITPIPEPATLGLITLFSGGIYFVRRFFVI